MRQTKKLINYESQVGLEEGVQKTYTWYKNNIFEGDQLTAK